MQITRAVIFAQLILCIVVALPSAQAQEPLRIAVASNFKPALEALLPLWAEQSNAPITLSSASSGTLTHQILSGAPFDILLAADMEYPEKIQQEMALPQPVQLYTKGLLALACRQAYPNVHLALQSSERLAIANQVTAPYGKLAWQWLQANTESLAATVIRAGSVAGALQTLISGNTDCALVAASLQPLAPNLRWYALEPGASLRQGALRLSEHASGDRFMEFLLSAHAQAKIAQYGYLPITP